MWPTEMWGRLQLAVLVVSLCALAHAKETKHNEDGNADKVGVRRDSESGVDYKYTRLSRRDAHLDIHMVEAVEHELKKRALDYGAVKWNKTVCFAFDKNYTDVKLKTMVKMTFSYISKRLCLSFVDISETINRSDPNWPINNGCKSNSYIIIANVDFCVSGVGAGMGGSPVNTGVCKDFYIALHEILHALTSAHVQEAWIAPSYISLLAENIDLAYIHNYKPRPKALSLYFDAVSTLMYEPPTWSVNGDPTYVCVREDMCTGANDLSSEDIIFLELNERYKCNEHACGNSTVDCYPGYYARVHGQCQCVCPSRFDSATNCKTFINGPNTKVKWPTPATILAGGTDSSCPAGMGPTGWVSFCGSDQGRDEGPVKFPLGAKNTVYLPVCSAHTWDSQDFYDWPIGGQFCIIKPKGIPCGGMFNNYTLGFTSACEVKYNGTIGDIAIDGQKVQLNLCCKSEVTDMVMDLPNDKPFRLFVKYVCPYVRGMRSYNYLASFWVSDMVAYGGPAEVNNYRLWFGFFWDLCYYMPPVYDCSQNVTFGISKRSVTINTPGYPSARLPNKRCFYCFNLPQAAHFVLTFLSYNMDSNDMMLYNRYNHWQENSRIDNSNPPTDLVSESNTLCVEYWSGYKSVSNSGASLQVEAILRQELCYNHSTRGENYQGDKSISETYETCLPWKDTVDCYESPYDPIDALLGYYEGNRCRNPAGKLRQPWCFVSKSGTNCVKRYCDVCNLQQTADALSTSVCANHIKTIPDFCTKSVQRYGCAKSCKIIPVKSDCPPGFSVYGARCFQYSTNKMDRAGAEKFCRSQGTGGTLYQVRTADDQFFLRQHRYKNGDGDTWISGVLDETRRQWLFTDSGVHMSYTNWSDNTITNDPSLNCVILTGQGSSTHVNGAWRTVKCQDSTQQHEFACQTNRLQTCGAPSLPADGAVVDPLQDFYYEGDRVAVGCRDGTLDSVSKYVMCKSGSWTKLRSVCPACPAGWSLHGKVCTYYNSNSLIRDDAEKFCRQRGPNGSLFRVHDAQDYEYARQQRRVYGDSGNDHMFISGWCPVGGNWTYTDSQEQVPFSTMTLTNKCNQLSYLAVYREYSSRPGVAGSMFISSYYWDSYKSLCQMDSREVADGDLYDTCQAALTNNPNFCNKPLANYFCPASCGLAAGAKVCVEPVSTTYKRTSASSSIKTGDTMTFTCKDGYFLIGGDTSRACGMHGQLLGQEPVCRDNIATIDVGLNLVMKRLRYLSYQAVLLDRDGLRVPFSGRITAWYCYTQTMDDITFLVFRKNGSSFKFVGANTAKCQPGWVWGVYVGPTEQIAVEKGDVVGVYTPSETTLYISDCSNVIDRSWPLPVATADNATAIQTAAFNTVKCEPTQILNLGPTNPNIELYFS